MGYSFTNAWGASWETYRANWLKLTGLSVIYLLAIMPMWGAQMVQVIANVLQKEKPESAEMAAALGSLGGILGCVALLYAIFVVIPLCVGVFWVVIRAVRTKEVEFSDILQGFRRFPRVLGIYLLVVIAQFVPMILGFAVLIAIVVFGVGTERFKDGVQWTDFDDYSRLALVGGLGWLLACVIVSWWIQLRTVFSLAVVCDSKLGAPGIIERVETSWRMTRGNALSLLGLIITVSVVMWASVCCCVLPVVFFGAPLTVVILATAYDQLLAQDGQATNPVVVQP